MSQIKIHVNDVRAENKAFKRMIGRIGDERDELSSIRRRLDGDITRRRNIDSRMSQAGSKLNDVQTRLQALYHFIEYGMDAYIQADDIARDHPFEKKKKKSIWDKIGGAINAAADGVAGFVEGVADAVIGTVEGIFNMIAHPIQTIQGLVYVVTHPVDVAVGIWTAVSESWNNDVVNGDAQSRGKWFGRMIGEVALAAVGTKGVDKIGKLAKGSKIVQEAAGVRIVPDALRSRLPGGKWQTGSPGKPEVEGTSLHLPREEKVKPPRSNNPDEEIKKRVLQNIERSKTARESSKFDEYLRKEKELLTEIEKKKVLEGTGETVSYYRVQGGEMPNASQVRIQVDANGKMVIPNKDANLNVSAGTREHAEYFQQKRGNGAEIVEVEVPNWFDDFVKENAIPQYKYNSNPLNQGGAAPKVVDPSTPGTSYEFPAPWIQWLEEYGKIKK
ncbi:hypothetical protein [Cohnella panacarvi]|uniref:hypothetical protein n=1 Tax=Cohnella panacarvi TaxID=400776 RepID=UPI000478A749|nr:hypothetical protein [Cohnella panacarvi]